MAIAERDSSRGAYLAALTALEDTYEERQRQGLKFASAAERVAAAASPSKEATAEPVARSSQLGSSQAGSSQADSSQAGASTVTSDALLGAVSRALPVLKKVANDVGEANRTTVAAMEALQIAMARELQLLEQVCRLGLTHALTSADARLTSADARLALHAPLPFPASCLSALPLPPPPAGARAACARSGGVRRSHQRGRHTASD